MRNILPILLVAFAFPLPCKLQQAPVYSQYILNEFLINPAVAGIDGMTTINLSGRKQWVGLKYTPETYSASISTRVLKSPFRISKGSYRKGSQGRVGLGGAFISDRNGAIERTTVKLSYAYHIFIQNYQLSFGLQFYGMQVGIDEDLIRFRGPDPTEHRLGTNAFIADAGTGVNFSTPNLHVGLTASHLLDSYFTFGDTELDTFELEQVRNYTLHSFYRTILRNKNWTFEPSIIVRGNENAQFSADLSARFIYKKEYWTGLAIRTSGELVLLAGMRWNRVYLGYSFDYGFNQLSYQSYGSHEVMLAVKLGESIRRYRWLERY